MNETEILAWLRGPGISISVTIFVLGLVFRVVQNFMIGGLRKKAPPKGAAFSSGVATIIRRSLFHPGTTYRGYFTMIAGYTFHIGFLVTLLFLEQHIIMFKSFLGFGWASLPVFIIDLTALVSIAALITILIHRLWDPVVRKLTDYQDYLVWILTTAPLITGYLTMHPIGLSYKTIFSLHLASVEILLIAIPFTKLAHMVSIFISRWYNGALAGVRGVQS